MSDPTTQSNYLEVASEHIQLDWKLHFDREKISGSATHHLLVKVDDPKHVIFDTWGLEISEVSHEGSPVKFTLGEKHKIMGSALIVDLPSGLKKGKYVDIKIVYQTSDDCTALQWLDKEQTSGKQFPYLFSQCQPIYARSIVPIQDTPSVKIKYSAHVVSTLPVLLSAIRQSPPSDGPAHGGKVIGQDEVTYVYDQPIPIPSYLIAIAVGNIHYRAFAPEPEKDWKSGIWAEPELLEKSHWEFCNDTTKFLAAEEKIVTPYRFGVYDLLVLPPSFPYGGMENACISFLTPTLLAGDRTLVDVVVHELTHSWFGNGVTHAHASHFWLNEGWTTYIERVLQEILHTPAHRGFSFLIGAKALKDALKAYESKPKYQRLVIDFEKGEDPDEAYSRVPYDKGANFILYLERTLGGLYTFLPYVKDYVNTFMGKSITTEKWKEHLYEYWTKHGGPEKIKALDSVDWNAWLYGEGTELPVKMEYDTTLAEQAYHLADRWDKARSTKDPSTAGFTESDLNDFNGNQIIVFLERLQSCQPLPLSHVKYLGELYGLVSTTNGEIRLRFYELALLDAKSEAGKAYAENAVHWVVGEDGTGIIKGRMKFCRPLFRKAAQVNHDMVVKIFESKKDEFHPIARRLIEKDLGLQ